MAELPGISDAAAGDTRAAGLGSGRSGLIARSELVAALERAATTHRVTIVAAPAGSGKTSLLHGWAAGADQERPIASIQVRAGQRDPQQFWLTLLAAIQRAAGNDPESRVTTPDFDGYAMVERILSELAEFATPVFLVIDDLHELSGTDALEQLTHLLTNLPEHVHAIVAARRDPPLRLHKMRLAGQLAEIRGAQLRFSVDETRQFLAAAGISLSGNAIAALHERTEGWAAGLRLAALSLAEHPDPERFVAEFSGSDRTVAEYLIAEMLERQPARVQDMLLRTALLDQVNGELADLLTESAGSEKLLLELEDANAFVLAIDPERTWFRYHHMFSGLLRLESRRVMPERIPGLHRLAASWLAAHGQVLEAIAHLQAAGEWGWAAELLTDHALSLTLDGRAATVQALLQAFPVHVDGSQPELAVVHAISALDSMHLGAAAAHLELARKHAAATPAERQQTVWTSITSLELLLARLRGNFDDVIEQVGSLPAAIAGESNADLAVSGDLRALALLNLGVTESWSLRLADSARHLREGAALAHSIGRPYLEVACRAQLAFASTTSSLVVAGQRGAEAIALAEQHGWQDQPVIAPALATLAGTMIWTGEFDRGEIWLERAMHVTRAGSEPGLALFIHLIAGMLHAGRGQLHRALEEFDLANTVQASMAGRHALASRVFGGVIATQARLGRIGDARTTVNALPERLAGASEIRTALAVVSLHEQYPHTARTQLRAVLDGAAPVTHDVTLVEAHLVDALASHAQGDHRAALTALDRGLDLAEPERLILPFAVTGAWRLLETLPPQRTSHAALIADILDAVRGGAPASLPTTTPAAALSRSELRLLRYLPTNLTRPEIASALSVSVNTVNTHIRSIYAKLGVTDRSGAVRRARELRLLSSGRTTSLT
ncbi:LuxR C-terminal-related transcriptional regulator [Nocardia sp. NPDC056100]|uniref:LuxR C-terminal-related transcriptional regulator n=1 Tax=Nocardia sp. NPDC056100 TaxID=3345712 RepID=UPI0035D992AB